MTLRTAVLDVVQVSKTFPGQKALDNANLQVLPGEVHALMGENGSGKSTLIKILAGFYLPDPGSQILVNGNALPSGSPTASFKAGLRFVHQHLGLIPELSAIENISLEAGYTRPYFINWSEQERISEQLISRLGIEMDLTRPLAGCSAVERAAVAIA